MVMRVAVWLFSAFHICQLLLVHFHTTPCSHHIPLLNISKQNLRPSPISVLFLFQLLSSSGCQTSSKSLCPSLVKAPVWIFILLRNHGSFPSSSPLWPTPLSGLELLLQLFSALCFYLCMLPIFQTSI